MKTFKVGIHKRITAFREFVINAESEDEAIEKAYEEFSTWGQEHICYTEDELSNCEEI